MTTLTSFDIPMNGQKFERIVKLTAKVSVPGQFMLFGKARLLPDRILVKGIGYSDTIMLDDIEAVGWIGDELTLSLRSGDDVTLVMRGAGTWKYEIQNRCGFNDPVLKPGHGVDAV